MLSTNAEVYTNTSGQQLRTKTLRKVEHLTHLGRHDGCAKYQRHVGNASGVVKSVIDERKEGIQTLKKTDSTPVSQTRPMTQFPRRGFRDLRKRDRHLQMTFNYRRPTKDLSAIIVRILCQNKAQILETIGRQQLTRARNLNPNVFILLPAIFPEHYLLTHLVKRLGDLPAIVQNVFDQLLHKLCSAKINQELRTVLLCHIGYTIFKCGSHFRFKSQYIF